MPASGLSVGRELTLTGAPPTREPVRTVSEPVATRKGNGSGGLAGPDSGSRSRSSSRRSTSTSPSRRSTSVMYADTSATGRGILNPSSRNTRAEQQEFEAVLDRLDQINPDQRGSLDRFARAAIENQITDNQPTRRTRATARANGLVRNSSAMRSSATGGDGNGLPVSSGGGSVQVSVGGGGSQDTSTPQVQTGGTVQPQQATISPFIFFAIVGFLIWLIFGES